MGDVNKPLITAGICNTAAALAHIGCIMFGGDWYRFFGAGEQMAALAEQGHWYPTTVTLTIAAILFAWALYAFSAARLIIKLPFTRVCLIAITTVFLLRALSFPWLMPLFPENSSTFWMTSSGICGIIGMLYAAGTYREWPRLRTKETKV